MEVQGRCSIGLRPADRLVFPSRCRCRADNGLGDVDLTLPGTTPLLAFFLLKVFIGGGFCAARACCACRTTLLALF